MLNSSFRTKTRNRMVDCTCNRLPFFYFLLMIQENQISQYVINKYKRNNTKCLPTNNTKEQQKHKTDSAYIGQIEEMAVRQDRPTITGHHHWSKQNIKKRAIRPNFGRLLFTVKKRVSPHWFFFFTLGNPLSFTQNAPACPKTPWPINKETSACKRGDSTSHTPHIYTTYRANQQSSVRSC